MSAEAARLEWLEERRHGIGGSDVAAVLGISPWKTPRQLWEEKLGLSAGQEETPIMKLGTFLEPLVAELYTKTTGHKVQRRHQSFTHPEHGFMRANIDREILNDPRGVGILEIKAMGLMAFKKTKMYGLPDYYAAQLQHYLFVTGRKWGAFAIMCRDTGELIHFEVAPDAEWHSMALAACAEFWRCIESQTPPCENASNTPAIDLPETQNGEVALMDSPEWSEAVKMLKEAVEIGKEAESLKEEAKARIVLLMNGRPVCEGAGARIYYREQAGRLSFDKKALAKDHPEINLALYEKHGAPTKAFKPYFQEA